MNKLFINKIIEPNGYTKTSSLSEIHIYVHISIRKPILETMRQCSHIQYSNLTRGIILNRINPYY